MRISHYVALVVGGYQCTLCKEKCDTVRNIKNHIRNNHVEPCVQCNKEVLIPHNCEILCNKCFKIHSVLCNICFGPHCVSVCEEVVNLIRNDEEEEKKCQDSHSVSECSKFVEVMQEDEPFASTSKNR